MQIIKSQNNQVAKTAILLFAFSNKAQSAIKPLSGFKKNNQLLWQEIIDHKTKTIQKTKLPFFLSDEKNQINGTFGQKLNHAIDHVFNQGFEKIIVVGNDCLSLTKNDLTKAEKLLQKNDFVLGKDNNGGAYLIGVSKNKFDGQDFENLAWQTNNLFQEINSLFNIHQLDYLGVKNDFNNQFDFNKAIKNLSFSSFLKKILFALINKKNQLLVSENKLIELLNVSFHFNKGPPLLDFI